MRSTLRPPSAFRTAALSLLYLGGSLLLAFPAVALVSVVASVLGLRLGPALFRSTILLCCGAGGALWARRLAGALGRQAKAARMATAAALGYGVTASAALYALTSAETRLLERAQGGATVPMHVAFAALFPSATFVVVFGTVLALALGAGARTAGPAARSASAAALSFLITTLVMDAAGWRVGAQGAEARFTMVVVLVLGLVAAAASGGAVIAKTLGAPQSTAPDSTDQG